MEWWLIGILIVILVLLFVIIGVPIAAALGLTSFIFLVNIIGFDGAITILHTELYDFWTHWGLLAIPIFIFMGELLFAGGQADDIFDLASKWLSSIPGGLAVATCGAAAIFSTMTGSSLGTTATFSVLAVPQMRNLGYSSRIACGSVCAAGGLAHLIPPSIIMVVYCSLLDLSIGDMFLAGVIPGILLTIAYILVAIIWSFKFPQSVPKECNVGWIERFYVLRKAWSPVVIIMAVMGTIYTGIATVTESAALGAFAAFIMALLSGKLKWETFKHVLTDSAKLTCFIMLIAVAGKLLSWVLTYYLIPQNLVTILLDADLNKHVIIIIMMIIFIIMGLFIDAIGIIVISMPIMYPIITALGFSPIWFGILLFITIEMALITPPLGLNLYIIQGVVPDIPLKEIMLGAFVFAIADIFVLILLIIFPFIALWLPGLT